MGFKAEPGRYHLYVSLACGWSHRTVIVRMLKRVEDVVSMSVVDPIRDERGWAFRDGDGHTRDPVNGFSFLSQAYEATDPSYRGRYSVPVLWDKREGRIVSNESADIIRMLGSEFDAWGDSTVDLYPTHLRAEIDQANAEIYTHVNDGVYKCGFAATQEAYTSAVGALFATLDKLEVRLQNRRYLVGPTITEADWRLFPTLVRFDSVYNTHFKCTTRKLVEYPSLWAYTRDLYQVPGVATTVDMDQIKRHYYLTHRHLNPSGIVPVGPAIDFEQPHNRAEMYDYNE